MRLLKERLLARDKQINSNEQVANYFRKLTRDQAPWQTQTFLQYPASDETKFSRPSNKYLQKNIPQRQTQRHNSYAECDHTQPLLALFKDCSIGEWMKFRQNSFPDRRHGQLDNSSLLLDEWEPNASASSSKSNMICGSLFALISLQI